MVAGFLIIKFPIGNDSLIRLAGREQLIILHRGVNVHELFCDLGAKGRKYDDDKPKAKNDNALHVGFVIEKIFNLMKIDRRLLVQIEAIVDFEEEPVGTS
jgi:hypothetical protein